MLATTYNRIRPYSLYQTIAKATHSIEACVVVGGDIFGFRDIDFALGRAIERGVKFRVLFPSPKSSWMKSFTEKGNIPVEVYSEGVFRNVDSVSRLGGMARWYSAPGPCWFILIDQRLLYTKPMSISSYTYPIQENRSKFVEHFSNLFDELWESSVSDLAEEFKEKPDPPRIECIPFSSDLIELLLRNPKEINKISPDAFEMLVADRLSAMGMGVKQVGSVNSKDGGIDIVAWPEFNFACPFLLAVQVKHSKIGRAVSSRTVRDMKGVLSSAPIDMGMIVTNTRFSPDAKWVATQGPRLVRLRDFEHLKRWLHSDFSGEAVVKELPEEISLAPGVRVKIHP